MQYIVNLAVIFLFCDFLGRNHINVISVIRLSQEGGVGIFSEKEGGYGMTLHAKNDKPGYISFRFVNFHSHRGIPPLVTALMDTAKMKEGDLSNPKIHTFF